MGNLCNCFIPKNVDEDYDFESAVSKETRRSNRTKRRNNSKGKFDLDEYEVIGCDGAGRFGSRRYSCETCQSGGGGGKRVSLLSNFDTVAGSIHNNSDENIFTISHSMLPSPVAFRESIINEKMGTFTFNNNYNETYVHSSLIADSLEQFYTTRRCSAPVVEKQRGGRTSCIWSLRPAESLSSRRGGGKLSINLISEESSGVSSSSSSSSLYHIVDDIKSSKIDVESMTESFDSGFGCSGSSSSSEATAITAAKTGSCSTISSIDMSTPLNSQQLFIQPTMVAASTTATSSYMVVAQQAANINKPKSLFRYLFDLSHLIRDALFEWPAIYLTALKQNLIDPTSRRRVAIEWQSSSSKKKRAATRKLLFDDVESQKQPQLNAIDKPLGIMGLLSKLSLFNIVDAFNIFNFFRPTVTATAAATINNKSTTFGYNPLRDFFLRLFDINFF